MKRGTRVQVATKSQHRQRLNLFGWVEPPREWYGFLRIPKENRKGFLKFLHTLDNRFKGWRIFLYIDKAKWHQGSEIDSFLSEHPYFDLEYLPSYRPELNLVECLWKHLRYETTTNKYFETIEDFLCDPKIIEILETSKFKSIIISRIERILTRKNPES
jgi:transposase